MTIDAFICKHPLVAHKISLLRNKETNSQQFRQVMKEVITLLGCWATEDLPLVTTEQVFPLHTQTSIILCTQYIYMYIYAYLK